jgi:hypothetical protein
LKRTSDSSITHQSLLTHATKKAFNEGSSLQPTLSRSLQEHKLCAKNSLGDRLAMEVDEQELLQELDAPSTSKRARLDTSIDTSVQHVATMVRPGPSHQF